MADKQFDLVFNAEMNIKDVRSALAELTKSLNATNINLPQSVSGKISKMVATLRSELDSIEGLSDVKLGTKNIKDINKSYGNIALTMDQLQKTLREINEIHGVDPEKLFPAETVKRINEARDALQKYNAALERGPQSQAYSDIGKQLSKAYKEQERLEGERTKKQEALRAKQGKVTVYSEAEAAGTAQKNAAQQALASAQKITQEYENQQAAVKRLGELQAKIDEEKKKQTKRINDLAYYEDEKNKRQAKGSTNTSKYADITRSYDATFESYNESTTNIQAWEQEKQALEQLASSAVASAAEVAQAYDVIKKSKQEITDAEAAIKEAKTKRGKAETEVRIAQSDLDATNESYTQAQENIARLEEAQKQLQEAFKTSSFNELVAVFEKLGVVEKDTAASFEDLKAAYDKLDTDAKLKLTEALKEAEEQAERTQKNVKGIRKAVKNTNNDAATMERIIKETEQLKNNILDFFSISNAINLFKQTLNSAIETVKELDAAMTETAVVTDFSIGDMWDKLPEYSKNASALGKSIVDLYDATTLYYQQGLNSQQSMALGVETLKMAAIAGMEGAEATEAMTAALRGFNMELNETSATRVNDVYSELAAITASDTSQIATAMSKTASIASSANMEFETTAALLAQIIETTQEAPETAGTAMKTIIARFTEVKELYDQGLFNGKDSEGEEININKIDAALKTVGISLKDFMNGTKGIDDIFLELASKWDSLDLATQRYIATTAAGSRQQSRFLAMISDYDRTMELVNAANDSAGASTEQFNKTLDSLEAKLTKLQNAWAEFTMGIANNDIIKAGVSILTTLLEAINQITTAGGNLDGITSSIFKLSLSLAALKGGSALFDGFFENYKKLSKTNTRPVENVFKSFGQLFSNKFGQGGKDQLINFSFKSIGSGLGELLLSLGKLALVIAAVVVVVKGLSIVWEQWQENQDDTKIEKISSDLKKFEENLNNAQNALSEVAEARTQLKDMRSDFQDLTQGTEEWTKALLGLNEQVLTLAQKYPNLQIEVGDDGVLSISEESFDALQDQLNHAILVATNSSSISQLKLNQLQEKVSFDEQAKEQKKVSQLELDMASFLESDTWLGKLFNKWVLDYREVNLDTGEQLPSLREQLDDLGMSVSELTQAAGVGITSEGLSSIANQIAASGIVATDGIDVIEEEKLRYIFNTLPTSMRGPFEEFIDFVRQAGGEFDNLIISMQNYDQKNTAGARQMISTSITSTDKVDSSNIDAFTNILEMTYSDLAEQVNGEVTKIGEEMSSEEIARRYAELNNLVAYKGKVYTDSSMQESVDVDEDVMKLQIATSRISQAIISDAEELETAFAGKNIDLINQLFSTEGSKLTASTMSRYIDESGQLKFDQIAMDANFEDWNTMLAELQKLGINVDDLANTLTSNFMTASDRITKARTKVAKSLLKNTSWSAELTANQMASWEEKFGEEITSQLGGIFDTFENLNDDILSKEITNQLVGALSLTNGTEAGEQIVSLIEDINWNNPIEAAARLREESERGTEATKNFAEQLLRINSSSLSAEAQLHSLLTSADYEEVTENLDEIIAQNGEISASDIDSLADEYKDFEKILDNTDITAAGLAKTLTLLRDGTLEIEDLNDALLKSLTNFESLESMVVDIIGKLNNLDLGLDEGEVEEKTGEIGDQLKELLENGEYGNSQLATGFKFFFGDNWDEGVKNNDERYARMNDLADILSSVNDEDGAREIFEEIANFKNFRGETFDESLLEGLKIWDDGTEIHMDNIAGRTSQEVAQIIANAYDVPYEMAEILLASFKNRSFNLAQEFAKSDAEEGLQDYQSQIYEDQSELTTKTVDRSDLNTLAKVWNVDEDALEDQIDTNQLFITDFYNKDGTLKEWTGEGGLLAQLNQAFTTQGGEAGQTWLSQFETNLENGAKGLKIDKLYSGLLAIGFTPEEANKLKLQIADTYAQGIEQGAATGAEEAITTITKTLSTGQEVKLNIQGPVTQEKIDMAMNEAEIQHTADVFSQKLAAAIKEAFGVVMPELSNSAAVQLTNQVTASIKAGEDTVTVQADPNSLQTMISDIGLVYDQASGNYVYVNGNTEGLRQAIAQYQGIVITAYIRAVPESGSEVDAITGADVSTSSSGGSGQDTSAYWSNKVYAEGLDRASSDHIALIGDGNGPELVKKANNTAYLGGVGGPEMAEINRGDTVYTAEETKKIFQRKGVTMPRFEGGGGASGFNKNYGSGGSGSGSGSDDEPWENPYDKLYNLVRKIDEELRERERIERRYEKLLTDLNTSANKIISVSREELNQLKREQMLQEQLVQGRRNQIEQWQQENAGMTRYGNVVTNDRGESVLRINWDLIDQVTDSDHGADIEDYISKLEEWFDSLQEAEDALWDIEDTIDEIKERGEEEYFELEDKIKEAVTQAYQDEIDELSAINDSINDTNSNLLDAIQKSIDKQRQDHDNQRTEDDLAEKQRRLLYLSQDTSGANQMEIMRLQKELEEGTEDYTDTLIDQKISELQEQNDEAATQREQQIDLLQAQLDHYVDTGEIWNEVYQLMESGLDPDGGLIRGSRLEEILKNADNFSGLSAIGKQEWFVDLNNMIAQALAYLEVGRQLEDIGVAAGSQIQFTDKNGNVLTGTVDGEGNVTTADGTVYNNVFQGADGKYYAGENLEEPEAPTVESPGEGSGGGGSSQQTSRNPYGRISDVGFLRYYSGSQMMTGNKVKILQWALNDMGYDTGGIDGKFGYMTHTAVMQFQGSAGLPRDGHVGPDTRNAMAMRGYKTGGLADFTGPAWLDGTKARPELVLNQRDTQNFIQLKDILSDVMTRMGSTSNSTENNGDTTYDIDINVESIGSDYDMDQMASYIKNMIINDARYRNNNVVSLKR